MIFKKSRTIQYYGVKNMNFKMIALLLFVSLLLMGTVCAQRNVSDFQVDGSYSQAYSGPYNALFLNKGHDTGVTIYRYSAGDIDDNDAYDDLIHDDGFEYLTADDDMQITKNSDNTVIFKDFDHANHGVSEVIEVNGERFIVVFWTKNTSNVNDADLSSQLNQFNQDNNVSPIAF